ncbi:MULTISPECIES: TIGR03364 family FAD-dependent oxidoreductase [Roseivirga]|jgi:FAD dependent oxidoreductase TIGR03364|uniref:TIGR03364 family FAD-dependent oxidoreductase n=1 Tax=Roseivirga TaxID=290180 RepID=UPI00257CDBB0|nr:MULTISPECIES: TIGR03364 family FAD-dependent oxidoreductase [Roseivirga]MEC7754083.1 TIGR03364 family FAD-dependent oxidoreductase [Bacteroidota bacterium]|tara:strand:- start:10251 stop:11360 length:1110 start_codon:yes stop_codon:yes gene_type:complete
MKKRAIVIGAGIVGLATARKLAQKGYAVEVLERGERAQGASIRNFGMIWPIGQPKGKLYERALRSRSIWKELAEKAGIWYGEVGSLHLAHRQEEQAVLEEFVDQNPQYTLLSPSAVRSEAVVKEGLRVALWSNEELIVDPREAIARLPHYLNEQFGVRFRWNTTAVEVSHPYVKTAKGDKLEADVIVVCNGADFETLYPERFAELAITKCKLQMMRLRAQPDNWSIGPALCGGLTLVHYEAFKGVASHAALKAYFQQHHSEYLKWGLNVMVSQNGHGELTVGDSHEYGRQLSPFNQEFIDQMILDYLASFAQFKDWSVGSRWMGIYPKMTNGATEIVESPEPGVSIINGLGGAGMTLSFGLTEEVLENL